MSLDHVLSKLQNVKKLGNGEYSAQCPAHDDKKNSSAIRPTNDRILLYCHAHCSFESVKQAAGLNLEDLHLNGKGNQANGHKSKSRLVAMYDYKDSSGKLELLLNVAYCKLYHSFNILNQQTKSPSCEGLFY